MRVWRIHIKNDYDKNIGYTQQDLLDFCQSENLIGVGWGEIKTKINSDAAIRQQAQLYKFSPHMPNQNILFKLLKFGLCILFVKH